MTYELQTWADGLAGGTPVNAARLNHMEAGILGASTVFNVQAFGAVGDGVTNDTAAIQATVDAAGAVGGTVYIPAVAGGGYLVTPQATANPSYNVALLVPSNVTIEGDATPNGGGSNLVLGGTGNGYAILNSGFNDSGNSGITIRNLFVVDSVTGSAVRYGIVFLRASDCLVDGCTVSNFPSDGIEGFAFDASLSKRVTFVGCQAAANFGSGFSANESSLITWIDCAAINNGTTWNGFTHNDCTGLRYIGCVAHGNATDGFNSEVSRDVSYVACSSAFIDSTDTKQGNANNGFTINGTFPATLDACIGSYNGSAGLSVTSNAQVFVNGGSYSDNTNFGIAIDSGSAPTTSIGQIRCLANGLAYMALAAGFEVYEGVAGNQPAVPSSASPFTNPFARPVTVHVTGGTVSAIAVGGTATGLTSGTFHLPPGQTITLTYTGSPSWVWFLG